VHAAHIRMGIYKTSRPIVKLYQLEVSSEDDVAQGTNDTRTNLLMTLRKNLVKTLRTIKYHLTTLILPKHVHEGMLLPGLHGRYLSG